MNERINKLALQAREHADSLLGKKLPDMVWQDEYHKKFAELIVRECTSFISDSLEAANVNLSSRPNDDYWLGFRHACDDHLTDIRQHFGVE